MSNHEHDSRAAEIEQLKEQDIQYNRVSSSKFIFYLVIFAGIAFLAGCSTQLWKHRFQKPDVEIQPSSQYTPDYK